MKAEPRKISQRDLRNDSGQVLREAEAGEHFIITRNGVPTAELGPVTRSRFVPTEELFAALDRLPPIDYDKFRADLDAVADPYVVDRYAEAEQRRRTDG